VNDLLEGLRAVSLAFGAVIVGGTIAEVRMIIPAVQRLQPDDALRSLKVMGPRAYKTFVPAGVIATLSAMLTLLLWGEQTSAARTLLVIALVPQWIAIITSLGFYAPTETRLRTAETPPPDYERLLARMARLNLLRTGFFFVGFVLLAISYVVD
jgi:Domain of unknown function (DUF1772)